MNKPLIFIMLFFLVACQFQTGPGRAIDTSSCVQYQQELDSARSLVTQKYDACRMTHDRTTCLEIEITRQKVAELQKKVKDTCGQKPAVQQPVQQPPAVSQPLQTTVVPQPALSNACADLQTNVEQSQKNVDENVFKCQQTHDRGACISAQLNRDKLAGQKRSLEDCKKKILVQQAVPKTIQSQQVCTDSDGGNNYNVKGTLTINGHDGSLPDQCQIKTGVFSYSSMAECSGDSCYLEEAYCDDPSKSDRLFPANYYHCPTGCKDGACLPAPTSALQPAPASPTPTTTTPVVNPPATVTPAAIPKITQCTDSDNGQIWGNRGTVTKPDGSSSTDFCLDDAMRQAAIGQTLVEYSCAKGGETYRCPNGCKDGACLATAPCATNKGAQCGCENKGIVQCDGSCSAGAAPQNYGASCGTCNNGHIDCNGNCQGASTPQGYGNSCGSCNNGRIDCNGNCQGSSTPNNYGGGCGCGNRGRVDCSGNCVGADCPSGQVCRDDGNCAAPCSGCLGGSPDCNTACIAHGKASGLYYSGGYCANQGSMNQGACCACTNPCPSGQVRADDGVCTVPCGRCVVAPAQNCDQACQNLRQGYTSGTCAAPTSTNTGACCACNKPAAAAAPAPTYSYNPCPGGPNCCCAPSNSGPHWNPNCNAGYSCRQWNVPGHQYFGTCAPANSVNPSLSIASGQPGFCGV